MPSPLDYTRAWPPQFLPILLRLLLLSTLATQSGIDADEVPRGWERLRITIDTTDDGAEETSPRLLMHFHGAPAVVRENFDKLKSHHVLVTVNCNGLSSAYRRPFESPKLFQYVLSDCLRQCIDRDHLPAGAQWSAIDLSSFSAGYGAVREILKLPANVAKIDGVVAADSIYASIHTRDGTRHVDTEQMKPFLDFAKLAVDGKKRFLISHSQLPVEAYASTVETADYLRTQFQLPFHQEAVRLSAAGTTPSRPDDFQPLRRARKGFFCVLAFAGDDGEAHLRHLREIAVLWKELSELQARVSVATPNKP